MIISLKQQTKHFPWDIPVILPWILPWYDRTACSCFPSHHISSYGTHFHFEQNQWSVAIPSWCLQCTLSLLVGCICWQSLYLLRLMIYWMSYCLKLLELLQLHTRNSTNHLGIWLKFQNDWTCQDRWIDWLDAPSNK